MIRLIVRIDDAAYGNDNLHTAYQTFDIEHEELESLLAGGGSSSGGEFSYRTLVGASIETPPPQPSLTARADSQNPLSSKNDGNCEASPSTNPQPVAWRFRWIYPETGQPTGWTETGDERVAAIRKAEGWEVQELFLGSHPPANPQDEKPPVNSPEWHAWIRGTDIAAKPPAQTQTIPTGIVSVCPECDIADCKHLRTPPQNKLRMALERLLDACIREFGWQPDAPAEEPAGNDPDCEITWGDLHEAHRALASEGQADA